MRDRSNSSSTQANDLKTKPFDLLRRAPLLPPQPVATAEDDGDDLKSVLGLSDLSSAAEGEDNPLSCVSAGSGDDDGSDTVQFVGKNTGRGGGSGGTSSGGCGRRMRELEWNRVEAINRGRRAAGAIRAAAASNPRAGGRGQQDGELR